MIEKAILKFTAFCYKLFNKNPRDDMKKFLYYDAIIFNLFQLFVMILLSIFFTVLLPFIGVFFIYGYTRKKGIMLHKKTPDGCFWWSNLTFVPEIVVMWLLKQKNIDLLPFVFFFGITNGLALSKDNKLLGLFAYKKTDKSKVQVKINRNNIRNILYQNFDREDVQERLEYVQSTTEVKVIDIATLKYKELMSNAEISEAKNYSDSTIKLVDNLLFAGFSDFKG